MTPAFMRLKELSISGDLLSRLQCEAVETSPLHIKTRAVKALEVVGNYALAESIMNCRRGAICGSPYCPDCRRRMISRLHKRLTNVIDGRYGFNEVSARRNLRHLTVLCEVTSLSNDSVATAVTTARKDIEAFKRRFPRVWLQGAFEFEVVSMELVIKGAIEDVAKQDTLSAMGRSIPLDMTDGILVHFHVVLDLNGEDPNTVKLWLRTRWDKHYRQTKMQTFRSDYSIEESLKKLAQYPFKNRAQYNHTFATDGFKGKQYFSYGVLGFLVGLYSSISGIGYSGILIGSTSQSR